MLTVQDKWSVVLFVRVVKEVIVCGPGHGGWLKSLWRWHDFVGYVKEIRVVLVLVHGGNLINN